MFYFRSGINSHGRDAQLHSSLRDGFTSRREAIHVLVRMHQLCPLACGIVLYVEYVMSMQVHTGALYLCPFLLNIYILLFRLKWSYAWADTLPLHGENCSAMNEQNINDVSTTPLFLLKLRGEEKLQEVNNSKRPRIQFNPTNCLHWGCWKSLMLQQISVYVKVCGLHLMQSCIKVTIVNYRDQ